MILLGSYSEKLIDTDRIIIQEINQNPELFLDISIKDFALQANAAVSTVSKFVRRIGFENYRTFQKHLSKTYSLQKEAIFLSSISLQQKDFYDVCNLKNCDFLAINETIKKIDFCIFAQLVTAIVQSRKIWVVGQGNSFLVAQDLANALNNINLTAFATNDVFGKINQLNYLTQQDILIFISEHFSQKEYQDLVIQLKKQKVKIGLITTINQFFVSQKIDFVINFFAFPQQNCPMIVGNAKIQQIFINNLLINAILKKEGTAFERKEPMKW